MPYAHSISTSNLTYVWPNGQLLFANLDCNFGQGRTGIVGDNGCGKSTLLRLIAGELSPSSGTITVTGRTYYQQQRLDVLTRPVSAAHESSDAHVSQPHDMKVAPHQHARDKQATSTVADLLGISNVLDAIEAISAGSTSQADFDAVGDNWDVEARAIAELASAGITVGALDRPAGTLSGGEAMTAAIIGAKLAAADITLLDEPTNNLDRYWRQRVYDLVSAWRGTLVIVSHDTELLEMMDNIAELRQGALTNYGGNFSHYQDAVAATQLAAARNLQTAQKQQSVAKQKRIDAEQKIAHSQRQGRKDRANSKYTKVVMNMRINAAERSQNARRGTLDGKVAEAALAVDEASRRIRDDDHISIEPPDPGLSKARRVAELVDATGRSIVLAGPERAGIVGRNGVGKSTLLERLVASADARDGNDSSRSAETSADTDGVARTVGSTQPTSSAHPTPHATGEALVPSIGYLSQSLDGLDENLSTFENVKSQAQAETDAYLKDQLARMLLRGDMISRPVRTLSGGERFRAAMAKMLLVNPPAQLLVLDEPTNNLDLNTTKHLVELLSAYKGAMVIVSHDQQFLDKLGLDAEYELTKGGELRIV